MKVLVLFALLGVILVSSTPLVFDPSYRAPFPIQLYFEVAEESPKQNLIVSPTSVTLCLALAYLGAGGKTADEFHDVLQFGGATQNEIAKFYGGFFTYIKSQSNDAVNISIGNRIYVDQKYNLAPTYNQLATEFMAAKAESIEFKNGKVAAEKINSWVEEETNNKIKDIVDASTFDETTAAVLVNAIYFKAPWKNPFSKYATQKRNFFLNKSEKVQVDMMNKVDTFEIADWTEIGGTAIRIPYANSGIYMLIVLPNEIEGLRSMEEKFKQANHAFMQTTPTLERVDLSLPKFKFEFEISLVKVLKEMGLKSMFQNADFSALLDGNVPLAVSDVKHKAFISVDEEGTEAAAATVVAMFGSSLQVMPEPRKITVDRPFMFVIRDQKTVYFAGHVVEF